MDVGCRFANLYASVCDCNFPSLVASLFSWRCLAASCFSSLHAAMNLRPPSVTASTQTSAFNAIVFQSPVMPNARMSLCTQSVRSFSFPPRPLLTAISRFPNMIRFGNRPRHIRRSVPAHKSGSWPIRYGQQHSLPLLFSGTPIFGRESTRSSRFWPLPIYQLP